MPLAQLEPSQPVMSSLRNTVLLKAEVSLRNTKLHPTTYILKNNKS